MVRSSLASVRACMLALLLLPGAPLLAAARQADYPNTSNFGLVPDQNAVWYKHCLRVQHRQAPTRDLTPLPPQTKAKACAAGKLYYEKRNQANTSQGEWDQVRRCALASDDSAVLMMLYANGLGVAQDADLAIKYACSGEAALAEMETRVLHLVNLQADTRRFDQCDDITSGRMGAVCAWIATEQSGKLRSAFLARLRARLTPAQQASLDVLVKASDRFAHAFGNDETDMGGTAGVQMVIDAEAREQEWLREHLAAFERGQFKLPAAEQFDLADAELNQAYARVMQSPATEPGHPGRLPNSTVDKQGVRATQRAWLAYRDAWIRFAAQRYPALDQAALKAALTQWRTKQLARLVRE
ncbi:MAG: hypothetical protein JWR65_284 [Massilia sp.]|nr:hypothetical protein [Massilia sp.]